MVAGQRLQPCLGFGLVSQHATTLAWTRARSMVAVGSLLMGALCSPGAEALPMSYAGSTTVGADVDPHWSTLWFSHAVDRRQGLGLSLNVLPQDANGSAHASGETGSGSHARQGDEGFLLLDYTRLAKRWNMPQAQANVWLFGGVGVYNASGSAADVHNHESHGEAEGPAMRFAARPGVQLDVETTRLRLEGRGLLYLAPGIQRPQLTATAGVALTPPRYDGMQPWLELQVRAMPGVIDTCEWIPKVRVLHKRVVFDVGYSSLGTVVGGITYTF